MGVRHGVIYITTYFGLGTLIYTLHITMYLYCKTMYHCISSLLTLGWGRGIRRVEWGPRRGCHTVSWRTVPS